MTPSIVRALAVMCLAGCVVAGQQNPQVPPAFRSAVTLVPVDVRVVDRDGRAVTDLKQEDFTLLENGVPQQIRHFSLQVLTPQVPTSATAPLTVAGSQRDTLSPQDRRLFLIVFGRGRLQEPSKGMDAVARFVREQILPQDQVAVFAYDRATRFTADHGMIGQVIERFRQLHPGIEALLVQQFAGLAAVYGSNRMPAAVRKEIDRIFEAPGALGSRQVVSNEPADAGSLRKDARTAADQRLQAMVLEEQAKLGATPTLHTELEQVQNQQFSDLPFDEFVAANAGTMQDLGKIYSGIEYLRHFDGEKHLVYISERGLMFLRTDDVDRLSRAANDARVVIDNIQTGGVLGGFRAYDLRFLSTSTGGQASISEYSRKGFDRVDGMTRAGYLLGYYPLKPIGDGRYREIRVKVNRRGVTAFFRHGYYAVPAPPPFERRAFLTDSRVMSAALYGGTLADIAVKAEVTEVNSERGPGKDVIVRATIDASRVLFAPSEDKQRGFLDVVVFFANTRKVVLGEKWQQIDLNLSEASYARVLKEGIPYTVRVPKQPGVRVVKIIVYDYQADLLGSAEATLK